MVLQQDASIRPLAKTVPLLVFAVRDQAAEHLAEAVEFDDLLIVQPVFDVPVMLMEGYNLLNILMQFSLTHIYSSHKAGWDLVLCLHLKIFASVFAGQQQ